MAIQIESVTKAYSGQNGECCCGCSGNYYYPEHSANSRNMIRKIVELVNANINDAEEIGNGIISYEEGNRLYLVNTTV